MIQRLRIRALIKHKGGASKVAALCGVSQPSVSKWAAQGSIPPKYARMLESLWGIDADLMHNPWGVDSRAWVSEVEQGSIVRGDYDLRLDAPRRTWVDVPEADLLAPVEFEPFAEGEGWAGEPVPAVNSGRIPSDEELDAFLKGIGDEE